MSKQSPQRKVVFLDTNTLHYLALFVRYACDNGFSGNDIDSGGLRKRIDQEGETGYKKSLLNGHDVVSFVLREDVQIEYSHVSMVELLCGRIRGAFIERLAKDGVPERMWSHLDEKEIREQSETDLPGIRKCVNDLASELAKWDIIFAVGTSKGINILELAVKIVGLVYMTSVDSIVYAEAIAARADYLVTEDIYLRNTVNLIHNPSDRDRYRRIKQKLQRFVDDDHLPIACKCSKLPSG